MKRRGFLPVVIVLLVLLGLYFLHPLILDAMAKYLVVQDKLGRADVIVVLGGDANGERVEEGVKLFKQGYAKYILMSGGPIYKTLTYAGLMKKQARESGVPEKAILLEGRSRSTIEDAKFCLPIIQGKGFKSLILVTSPYHCRRAGKVFRKVFVPAGIRVMVYPAQKSEFNPNRWWTRHEDTGVVVWEYVAMVMYFFRGY